MQTTTLSANKYKSLKTPPDLDPKVKEDWNLYVDWLESQNMRGSEVLDNPEIAAQMIQKYREVNPSTTVSLEIIPDIQREANKHRQLVLEAVKSGKAALSPGVTEEAFMQNLSTDDGIAGSKTTSFKFPSAKVEVITPEGKEVKDMGKVTGVLDYSKIKK